MYYNGKNYWINHRDEDICVAVHDDLTREPIEFFRLQGGHLAITRQWTDEEIVEYLDNKLCEREIEK